VCKEALSYNKCVLFAAIIDSYGKIVVGDWNNKSRRSDEIECKGFRFYQDHLLPTITSMTSYGSDSGMNKVCPKIQSQMFKVGLKNRVSVAHMDGDSNSCKFLVVFWRI
jgi:hypothetical protein